MAAYVTYLGDPGKSKTHKLQVAGTEDWSVDETRKFDKTFVASVGCSNPDDPDAFALMFVTVQNANLKVPRFALSETDPNVPKTKPDKSPPSEPSPAPAEKAKE